MFRIRASLRGFRPFLQAAIVLLAFALASACQSSTDSDCEYNPDTQECD